MKKNIINVELILQYIEDHLSEKLDLETIANAIHYSKFHMHRVFVDVLSMKLHEYVLRRRLSEAAKLLVFSNKKIIEIALIAGYESQQAFTTIFTSMYKKSPNEYRKAEDFYPLQLRIHLNNQPTRVSTEIDYRKDIRFAQDCDIPLWMELVHHVIDGFPYLKDEECLEAIKQYVYQKQAFVIYDEDVMIGAMAFDRERGSIDFLGIHPQYRKHNIASAFLKRLLHELMDENAIYITTFREGDKADTGYREAYKKLGFAEGELLVEFGYPTQKMIIERGCEKEDIDE